MSMNIQQVYVTNPSTTIGDDDLLYLGLSPFGLTDDSAIDGASLKALFLPASAAGLFLLASNNLSDVANASTARTNLGLAIGTNVQAQNAALQSIAGLTTVANNMIYTTGANTYATVATLAFGRSLLGATDAAAGRTLLGLGTMATQSAANYLLLAGGTMTGDINMGAHNLLNVDQLRSAAGETLIDYVYTASAVNYLEIANSTAGSPPVTIQSRGISAAIPLNLGAKGGVFQFTDNLFGTSAKINLYNAIGTLFTGLQAAPTIATSTTYTLPNVAPTLANQSLVCDTSGSMSWGGIVLTAASTAQQQAATSNVVAVTPAVQQSHPSAVKWWVYWLGSGAPGAAIINASYNVASVIRGVSAGTYVINLTNPMTSAGSWGGTVMADGNGQVAFCYKQGTQTTSAFPIQSANTSFMGIDFVGYYACGWGN